MRTLLANLKNTIYFLLPYGIFLLSVGLILFLNGKEDIHICINKYYNAFADRAMPWITLGGDGIIISIAVLLLCVLHRRFGLFTGISCLLASGITQLLKHTIYFEEVRPKLFFSPSSPLRFVPGVENYLYNTFPSGHATLAFAFFFSLAIIVKNKVLQLLLFTTALLIGFSRIYLSQHFLGDVFFGSLIGTSTTLVVMTYSMHKGWLTLSTGKI